MKKKLKTYWQDFTSQIKNTKNQCYNNLANKVFSNPDLPNYSQNEAMDYSKNNLSESYFKKIKRNSQVLSIEQSRKHLKAIAKKWQKRQINME